jgi:hypothetical protein
MRPSGVSVDHVHGFGRFKALDRFGEAVSLLILVVCSIKVI